MTLDIELPIKKSACKAIREFELLIPIVILVFLAFMACIIGSTYIGQLLFIIYTNQMPSHGEIPQMFPLNIGGWIGWIFGIAIIGWMFLREFGVIKFHCKG